MPSSIQMFKKTTGDHCIQMLPVFESVLHSHCKHKIYTCTLKAFLSVMLRGTHKFRNYDVMYTHSKNMKLKMKCMANHSCLIVAVDLCTHALL